MLQFHTHRLPDSEPSIKWSPLHVMQLYEYILKNSLCRHEVIILPEDVERSFENDFGFSLHFKQFHHSIAPTRTHLGTVYTHTYIHMYMYEQYNSSEKKKKRLYVHVHVCTHTHTHKHTPTWTKQDGIHSIVVCYNKRPGEIGG